MTTPNIGPRERRRRRVIGMVGVALGLGILGALVGAGLPRLWRLTTFPPYWLGALGWLQAREKT